MDPEDKCGEVDTPARATGVRYDVSFEGDRGRFQDAGRELGDVGLAGESRQGPAPDTSMEQRLEILGHHYEQDDARAYEEEVDAVARKQDDRSMGKLHERDKSIRKDRPPRRRRA